MDQLPAALQDELMRGFMIALGIWLAAITAILVVVIIGVGIAAVIERGSGRKEG